MKLCDFLVPAAFSPRSAFGRNARRDTGGASRVFPHFCSFKYLWTNPSRGFRFKKKVGGGGVVGIVPVICFIWLFKIMKRTHCSGAGCCVHLGLLGFLSG